jgi:hypothetical protein
MALLLFPKVGFCDGGKSKCSICAMAIEIQFFLYGGEKLKHRRVGNEFRLTRCPFVVLFLCRLSPVKMVYFFLVYSRLFFVVVSSFTLACNSHIHATPINFISPYLPTLHGYAQLLQ